MNEVIRWVLSILISAVVGSYIYTYKAVDRVEDKITVRLDRFEEKLDEFIRGAR